MPDCLGTRARFLPVRVRGGSFSRRRARSAQRGARNGAPSPDAAAPGVQQVPVPGWSYGGGARARWRGAACAHPCRPKRHDCPQSAGNCAISPVRPAPGVQQPAALR
ncbi:hypothetical protein GCM10010233_52150 [Streptomyces pseudogriseolus]|nr:hypothetical protein GCM10010233_52150 [Streptomyces gancidicus]